jgi:hypothetical protein
MREIWRRGKEGRTFVGRVIEQGDGVFLAFRGTGEEYVGQFSHRFAAALSI